MVRKHSEAKIQVKASLCMIRRTPKLPLAWGHLPNQMNLNLVFKVMRGTRDSWQCLRWKWRKRYIHCRTRIEPQRAVLSIRVKQKINPPHSTRAQERPCLNLRGEKTSSLRICNHKEALLRWACISLGQAPCWAQGTQQMNSHMAFWERETRKVVAKMQCDSWHDKSCSTSGAQRQASHCQGSVPGGGNFWLVE